MTNVWSPLSRQFPPQVRGGTISTRLATGTHVLLAAPPAGYLNVIVTIVVKNNHASSAMTYRIFDADGDTLGPATNSLAAQAQTMGISGRPTLVTQSAISITISGTGTPADVHIEWHRIPIPTGWKAGVVALTSAYQTIPNVVPASGISRIWCAVIPAMASGGLNLGTIWNGDSALVLPQFRLIRSGVTYDFVMGINAGTTIAAYTISGLGIPLLLLPGDQFSVKVSSIVTPGAAILRMYSEQVRRAA